MPKNNVTRAKWWLPLYCAALIACAGDLDTPSTFYDAGSPQNDDQGLTLYPDSLFTPLPDSSNSAVQDSAPGPHKDGTLPLPKDSATTAPKDSTPTSQKDSTPPPTPDLGPCGSCNDNDPCTTDSCVNNKCVHTLKPPSCNYNNQVDGCEFCDPSVPMMLRHRRATLGLVPLNERKSPNPSPTFHIDHAASEGVSPG